ncbi:hypothetical protein U1Q18_029751, partial [Sarracenia purpurea var. burkii]
MIRLPKEIQPKLSEFGRDELSDTGDRVSNPQSAQPLPQSAGLGQVAKIHTRLAQSTTQLAEFAPVSKNKEVKVSYEERNTRIGTNLSPEVQGKLNDPSPNREELTPTFKNKEVSSGLQLISDPKEGVIPPDLGRESPLQLCVEVGPPFSEILRDPKAKITGNIMVNLQHELKGRKKVTVPSDSSVAFPESAENPPLPITHSADQVKGDGSFAPEGKFTQIRNRAGAMMIDEMDGGSGMETLGDGTDGFRFSSYASNKGRTGKDKERETLGSENPEANLME